jgi:leucyl aminopeptidase
MFVAGLERRDAAVLLPARVALVASRRRGRPRRSVEAGSPRADHEGSDTMARGRRPRALSLDMAELVVGVPVCEGEEGPVVPEGMPEAILGGAVRVELAVDPRWCRARGFKGGVGTWLPLADAPGGPRVVLLGLGQHGTHDAEAWRLAGAALLEATGELAGACALVPSALVSSGLGSGRGEGDCTGGEGRLGSGERGGPAPTEATGTRPGRRAPPLDGGDRPDVPSSPPGPAGAVGARLVEGGVRDASEAARHLLEGAALAAYRFDRYRSQPRRSPVTVGALAEGVDERQLADAAWHAAVVADAVWFARHLVNEPAGALTPRHFAAIAAEALAPLAGVTVEVWDEERIEAERLGALLGVARGSAEPPRLVVARYVPDRASARRRPHVVFVGKGITFDSGGLSLKSAEGMTTMKTDMSGSAAALAALGACTALGVDCRVTALAPLAENMPGGRAIKPGDVLVARDGTTIEVLNTDAEGRLVLADAIVVARELSPDVIVDLATLTGACVTALGRQVAGLFGNDERVVQAVQRAAARAGEAVWPMPLPDAYRSHLDSEVADLKNVGRTGEAGAIAGAMFLARFADGARWAHLDIAGPARAEERRGLVPKGGTGFGVRTLVQFVLDVAAGALEP